MTINNRYRIKKLLGTGRTKVFLAEDVFSPERNYAIKIIPSEILSEDEIDSLKSEFNLLNSLNHPNIVKAYECGLITDCDDKNLIGSYFFISEFVKGKNLLDFFSSPAQENQFELFLQTLNQISITLYYIHQLGIIHYDIRPENILIEGDDKADLNVKLIDFGFSALKSFNIKGTPLYISPELISGKKVDYRTDLYSLGATLYHILSGHPPFYSENEIEIFKKHLEIKPQKLPDYYPDYINKIVLKLLEKDPDDRFQNSLEILELLPDDYERIKNIWYIPKIHFAREKELQELIEFSEQNENTFSTLFVISEEGMGKSFLIKKYVDHLDDKKNSYFFLNVSKEQSATYDVLSVLLNQIESFIRYRNFNEKEEISNKINHLKELYNSSLAQLEFLEYRRNYLSELLINLAKSIKFLVVIDDFQNLDNNTKNFFYYIYPSLVDLGIKFILAVDRHFITSKEIERFRNYKDIVLAPLTRDEIIRMLKSYFNFNFPYDTVADLMIEYTSHSINEKNEFLTYLFFEEIITFDAKGFKINKEKLEQIDLEKLALTSYELKLQDLRPIQKTVLEILSLINFPLKLSDLAEVLTIDLNQLEREIEFLNAFGWIEISGKDELIFLPSSGIKKYLFSKAKNSIELNRLLAEFFEIKNYPSFVIAESYERSDLKEKALEYYSKAVSESEKFHSFSSMEKYLIKCIELENRPDKLSEFRYNLAKCYFNQADFKNAEELINKILKENFFADEKLFDLHLMLAIIKYKTGEIEEAFNNFNNAYRFAKTDQQKVEVELNEINLEISQGDYNIVMKKCQNLLNDYSEILSPSSRAAIFNNLGIVNSKAGFYTEAVSYFNQAFEIYDSLNNKVKSSQVLMNLGNVFNLQSKQEEALKFWKQALELNETIGDLSKKALILNNIGISFFENINLEEAIEYYQNARNLFEKINDQFGEALSLYNLAESYFLISDFETALSYVKKSIDLSTKLLDVEGQCQGLFLLGLIYYVFYQIEELKNVTSNLIAIIENNKMQATQLQNYLYLEGLINLEEKNYSEAEIKLNLSKELYSELDGKFFYCKNTLDLMRLSIYTGNFPLIQSLFNELQKNEYFKKNKLLTAEAYLIIGDAAKRPGADFPHQSLFYYSEAMKYIENAYIGETTFQVLVALGEEYLVKGAVNKGLDYFKKAKLVMDFISSKFLNNKFKNSYFAHPLRKRTLEKIERVINNL